MNIRWLAFPLILLAASALVVVILVAFTAAMFDMSENGNGTP